VLFRSIISHLPSPLPKHIRDLYNPDESSHEFILKDASKTGSCIILPVDKWDGTYNQEWNKHFPPIFSNLQSVSLQFCNSKAKILIRSADIAANKAYYLAVSNNLDKLCNRMMDRYTIFANEGVKNIATYNERMAEVDGEKMPFIIVFVDEFAELMLSKKANLVEEKIQKIVQLGRAAGIHLILATQRPDVNVITGTIKSNLPCRMTFRLSSLVDSRTVIDVSGAEKLLNNGDMLLLTPDYTGLRRVQGVYVSDEEIEKCVEHCKNEMGVNYDDYFMDLRTEEEKYDEYKQNNLVNNQTMTKEDNDDILYQQIKDYVLKERKASTSLFQRKFSIGASRAGRMLDRLEEDGIVGPENGTKAREVLIEDNSSIENDD